MTKKHLRYLFTFLFLTIVGIGGAKADSYTIQFSNKASSATAISSSTNRQTVIGTGYAYVAEKPFTVNNGNVYYGDTKTSIRLGKTGTASSLSIALLDNGKVYATSIVVNCKNMGGTKNSNATLTVNGEGPQTTSSEEGTDHIFNINNNIEDITLAGSAAIYVYKITVNYTNGGSSTLSPAGLSYGETTSYTVNLGETFTSPTLTNPNSLTVAYSSSDIGVATVDANTGAVTLVGAGTTTITASSEETSTYAAGSTYYTLKVIDPNAPGTENNPYTVTQARAAIDAGTGTSNVYVTGIVSQVDQFNSNYNSITYWISDDGTSTNQFEVYSGKGINGANFESIDDVQVGDVVVVKGNIKKYNSTYEFDYNNELVSLTRKKTPTLSFSEDAYSVVKNGTLTINATSNSTGAITYQSSNTDVAEIDATTGVVTAKAAGTTTITATIAATEEYKSATATVELTVTAPKHKVTFYQNGTKLFEEEVSEDAAITFPVAEAEINGKAFVGWIASAIEGETNDAPAFVTTATMGTSEVNYYAVFANLEGESTGTYTLDYDAETQLKNATLGYGNAVNYTAADGSQWVVKAYKSSGMQINKSKNSSIKVPTCPGAITSIAITGSTEKAVGFSANDYSGSGTINYLAEGSDATEQTLDLSEQNTTSGYIVPKSGSISITKIVVNYSSTSYSAYCTTVEAEQPVVEPGSPVEIAEGYYSIKNGNGQYVNVAGRKTVTFVDESAIASAPGTVIKVEANENGQVQVLRSQGVDIPGYAEKAMNYVPKIVKLVVDKLHAEGSGTILGENGLDAIMAKFDESFDYHLYTEQAKGGIRIYGKTPSMQPVVDFYAKNKTNVDAKLPMLETFINDAIQKILNKTNGSGASILVPFSLETVWQKMGGTLTKPVDDASKLEFLQQVLADKENVWKFAYETAMIYWKPLINHQKVKDNLAELGDLAQYVEKLEYIRPDVKYYLVQNSGKMDVFSQDNPAIINNEAGTLWKLENRETFDVIFDEANTMNGGKELYTTLYTDFAYTLPENVKAYAVTAIHETSGIATKKEISGVIPAQTPVLLKSTDTANLSQTLELTTEPGTAPEMNLLVGPDYIVDKYEIKSQQIKKLFDVVHDLLTYENMESLYDQYVKEYEHLMMRNSGTVNNKYFFGLSGDDIAEADVNICQLSVEDSKLAFYHNLEKIDANKAFIPTENVAPVKLSLIGDVNRDGEVNSTDIVCIVDITLHKAYTPENTPQYDFDAADADGSGSIDVTDIVTIVNIIL